MLFVPLPIFATFCLGFLLVRLVRTRDMTIRVHQMFALLIGLYGIQSLLLCLRWGYGYQQVGWWSALIAPSLPVVAYLAYVLLAGHLSARRFWPVVVLALNWALLLLLPALTDVSILITYLGIGATLLWRAWRGTDMLPLSRISDVEGTLLAMRLTGAALVASALTDVYLIFDFVRNDGQAVGLIVTFVHTALILAIGLSAALGPSHVQDETDTLPEKTMPTQEDDQIFARLIGLFQSEGLHKSEDLSLRRLSRRLGLPDRSVSNAVNRIKGVNVSQFVNEFRVTEACTLLAQTDMTILDVSLASGFATKSNFNREFVRVTGQTPSKWRQSSAERAAIVVDP